MIDAGKPVRYNVVPGKHLTSSTQTHEHSTAMYKFITEGERLFDTKICPDLVVDTCEFMVKGEFHPDRYYFCLNEALSKKYDIVNMSLSGGMYDVREGVLISLIKQHSVIVVAAGNEGKNHRDYPSIYATGKSGPIYAISAIDKQGHRLKFSNKDNITIDFLGEAWYNTGFMQGTSVAAALFTNGLIRGMCDSRRKD
jgi:subtilisin family serine protease